MRKTKMHADEIATDVTLVRRLLQGQFPACYRMSWKHCRYPILP
jgi:hypothetical protein